MKKLLRNWKTLLTVCLIFGLVGCGPDCPEGEKIVIKMTGEKAMLLGYGLGGECVVRLENMERMRLSPFEYETAN